MAYYQNQRPNYQQTRPPPQHYPPASNGWYQEHQQPPSGHYDQGGSYGQVYAGAYDQSGYERYDSSQYGQYEQGDFGVGSYQHEYPQEEYYIDQYQQHNRRQIRNDHGYDQRYDNRQPASQLQSQYQEQYPRNYAPSRLQMQPSAPGDSRAESRNSNRSKPRERILQPEPESPTTMAWDNPFPTFPAKKKANGGTDGLAKEMGGLDLKDKQRSRPGTSQSNYADSRRPYGQNRSESRQDRTPMSPDQQLPPRGQSRQGFSRPPPQAPHEKQWDQRQNTLHSWQQDRRAPFQDSFQPQPIQRQQTWQDTGPAAGQYQADPNDYPQRPNTSGGQRPPPNGGMRSFPDQQRAPPRGFPPPQQPIPPIPRQPAYTPVTNQYYSQNSGPAAPASSNDVPNFDITTTNGHKRGPSIDRTITQNAPQPSNLPPNSYQQTEDFSLEAHRSKSQPDLRGKAPVQNYEQSNDSLGGFSFDFDSTTSRMPPIPDNYIHGSQHRDAKRSKNVAPRSFSDEQYHYSRNGHLPSQNNVYGNEGYRDGDGQQNLPLQGRLGPRPGSAGDAGPPSQGNGQRRAPPDSSRPPTAGSNRSKRTPNSSVLNAPLAATNPDALPAHPPPVRPGLVQQTVPNQAPKPAPVRQYIEPKQHTPPVQAPPAEREERRDSRPVTKAELAQLQELVKAKPNDKMAGLRLAKKMIEASTVLADEGGKADTKTRNRNREKYILDAHKLLKKLVNTGDPEAMFFLADCHGQGSLGLVPDAKEAFGLYVSAAKLNHPPSCYRVAVCCEMGLEEGGGTRRDPLKAIQWYKRAATLKDPPAMYKMGMILLKGLLGQQRNPREAVSWLKRAADRADEENPHALHELGLLYESASPNDAIVRDEQYSKDLFEQAAKLGYKFSQFRLGQAFEYGQLGCPIDPRQSITWYSKAAAQEEHQAELALSGWYLTGADGIIQQSDTEAYLWARKSASSGLAKAEYAMGYFTEVGIGAPANLEDAKRWYWRAASQNYPKARDRLEDLKKGGGKMQKKHVSRSNVNRQSEGDCVVM